MKPIRDEALVGHYGRLIKEMMLTDEGLEYEFNSTWVQRNGWEIVPVESAMRFPEEDIPRIVSVLNRAGYLQCVAIFNEAGYIKRLPVVVTSDPPSEMPTCYFLTINEQGFRKFNQELGIFRSVLMPDDRSWAISCNESYNLFAGFPDLLEPLLGKSIPEARQEFAEFAALLAEGDASCALLKIAERYASL
jgi:hypothetical protein